MFKKAVNKYFSWRFHKRVLILAIVIAILVGIYDLFALGDIQIWLPKQEVYSYFDHLATEVINLKNIDFLRHLDDLDYLKELEGLEALEVSEIYENSNILNHYIITERSKENTITVELNGHHSEVLTLVISRDYKLVSLDKVCNHTLWLCFFALIMIFVYYGIGYVISTIINLVFILLQKIAEYCSRIRKYFSGLRKNKKAKSESKAETALDADLKPESEAETVFDTDSDVISEDLPNGQHDQDEKPEESEDKEADDYSSSDYEF